MPSKHALPILLPLTLASAAGAQWSTDPALNTPVAVGPGPQRTIPGIMSRPSSSSPRHNLYFWTDETGGTRRLLAQGLGVGGYPYLPLSGTIVSANVNAGPIGVSAFSFPVSAVLVVEATGAGSELIAKARSQPLFFGPRLPLSADDASNKRNVQLLGGSFGWPDIAVWSQSNPAPGIFGQWFSAAQHSSMFAPGGTRLIGNGVAVPRLGLATDLGLIYTHDESQPPSLQRVEFQRFGPLGEALLNGGQPIVVSTGIWPGSTPRAVGSTSLNGVCWEDQRGAGGAREIWLQKIDPTGAILWPAGGVRVAPPALGISRELISYSYTLSVDRAAVYWIERDALLQTNSVRLQIFDTAGNPIWPSPAGLIFGPTAVPITEVAPGSPTLAIAGPPGGNQQILAMSLDGAGMPRWPEPAVIANAPGPKSGLVYMSGTPWAVVSFTDGRADECDVYAQVFEAATGRLASPTCYANCDNSTTQPALNVLDFNCFLNHFAAGDSYANCDGSTTAPVLNVLDFNCWLGRFSADCD
jgi:hypothetical protein